MKTRGNGTIRKINPNPSALKEFPSVSPLASSPSSLKRESLKKSMNITELSKKSSRYKNISTKKQPYSVTPLKVIRSSQFVDQPRVIQSLSQHISTRKQYQMTHDIPPSVSGLYYDLKYGSGKELWCRIREVSPQFQKVQQRQLKEMLMLKQKRSQTQSQSCYQLLKLSTLGIPTTKEETSSLAKTRKRDKKRCPESLLFRKRREKGPSHSILQYPLSTPFLPAELQITSRPIDLSPSRPLTTVSSSTSSSSSHDYLVQSSFPKSIEEPGKTSSSQKLLSKLPSTQFIDLWPESHSEEDKYASSSDNSSFSIDLDQKHVDSPSHDKEKRSTNVSIQPKSITFLQSEEKRIFIESRQEEEEEEEKRERRGQYVEYDIHGRDIDDKFEPKEGQEPLESLDESEPQIIDQSESEEKLSDLNHPKFESSVSSQELFIDINEFSKHISTIDHEQDHISDQDDSLSHHRISIIIGPDPKIDHKESLTSGKSATIFESPSAIKMPICIEKTPMVDSSPKFESRMKEFSIKSDSLRNDCDPILASDPIERIAHDMREKTDCVSINSHLDYVSGWKTELTATKRSDDHLDSLLRDQNKRLRENGHKAGIFSQSIRTSRNHCKKLL
ncbi:hypothetical protein ADUPG1_002216 [Aduncisulcus paluster]|uniref:Uncharacterized protein n=1 Tax=Aduncisulcus paluster TaxID=2918883 RepID=A0ABQ5KJL9_9EUKA|nr:hypothetical protein ADUPG1_002216 [Aduncisulcus paluster]